MLSSLLQDHPCWPHHLTHPTAPNLILKVPLSKCLGFLWLPLSHFKYLMVGSIDLLKSRISCHKFLSPFVPSIPSIWPHLSMLTSVCFSNDHQIPHLFPLFHFLPCLFYRMRSNIQFLFSIFFQIFSQYWWHITYITLNPKYLNNVACSVYSRTCTEVCLFVFIPLLSLALEDAVLCICISKAP